MKNSLYIHRILNMSQTELAHAIKTGRVQQCKKCNSVQKFERKTFKRWNDVCIKCTAKQNARHLNKIAVKYCHD